MGDRRTVRSAPLALMINVLPALFTWSMAGLVYGFNPWGLFYGVAQLGGFFGFGLAVIGSAMALYAAANTEGRDWRVIGSFALLGATIVGLVVFLMKTGG